ncbi:energy transducer TonB [Tenacibaculum pacificus]|uniref:energy transducer TonB n=1 Tax=Tenacibaculum TaxID=104267 RepID=UPI0022F3BF32|nr:energy transducer TonB [Tenacibaculum pacificus]WBX73467.1 energy transducer TonB [Tenacibaculum pacificus]
MRELLLLVLTCFFSINVISQEVCESPDKTDLDLNTISITKCTIKKSKKNKKSRQISVTVSASRRHLKKRQNIKKKELSSIGSIGLVKVKKVTENLEVTKSISSNTNIEDIKKKLSIEELKSAAKFNTVDKIPLFNACKKVKKGDRVNCFNEKMVAHISKHFRYPSDAIQESIQGEVWVRFIIDKNGEVKNIKTLGPRNGGILNKEAVRVVSKLPQFIPAKKDGGRVSVKYGFPISFALEQ